MCSPGPRSRTACAEAAAIDGAGTGAVDRAAHQDARAARVPGDQQADLSIIGSFQLFNEPSVLQSMVPGNTITTYYTPNMYVLYNLSFMGGQSNYAAAMAIADARGSSYPAIAYIVQLRSMKEQMK